MQIKKFSELSDEILEKIIIMHYRHWSQFNPKMDLNTTKDKFKTVYAQNNSIPFGIAMLERDQLIGFFVLKKECLYKYPQFTPWISDVMINDKYRNQGYGRKLIKEALVILKELGFKKVYLWTDQAPDFYQKLGFVFEQIVEKNEGGFGNLYSIEI